MFTTVADEQTEVNVRLYEGEQELVKDNNQLGDFMLSGITPKSAGVVPVIDVTFSIDANGILTATAVDMASG